MKGKSDKKAESYRVFGDTVDIKRGITKKIRSRKKVPKQAFNFLGCVEHGIILKASSLPAVTGLVYQTATFLGFAFLLV